MSPGHWEILIVATVLLFLFWPYIVRALRFFGKLRAADDEELDESRRRKTRSPRRVSLRCPHCDGTLPEGAEFCPRCGRRVGIIDV